MGKKITLFIILSALLSAIPVLSQEPFIGSATEVGFTEGALSVSLSGAANYTIPLQLPPGINGVVPKIGISYNSQSGVGMLGYGWNLTGLSAIARVPSTKFHDDKIEIINYNRLDNYALDGQRLLLKSGIHGRDGAVYETENYSNTKVTLVGGIEGAPDRGPDYFIVEYADGSKAYYGYIHGNTSHSRSQTEYSITYWENPQGLRINYYYTNYISNTTILNSIRYGSAGTDTPINEVVFTYKNRLKPEEFHIAGLQKINDKIISEIQVKGNGVVLRNYVFEHTISVLGHEKLVSIQEKTGDNTKSYPKTVFQYVANLTTYSKQIEFAKTIQTTIPFANIKRTITGDFDGDGEIEILTGSADFENHAIGIYKLNRSDEAVNLLTQTTPVTISTVFSTVNFLDSSFKKKNRQGWCTVEGGNNAVVKVYSYNSNTGSADLEYQKSFTSIIPEHNSNDMNSYSGCFSLPGDFNGDGLTDLLFLKNNGDGTLATQFVDLDRRLASDLTYNSGTLRIGNVTGTFANGVPIVKGSFQFKTGDFDGDGKTNLIIFRGDPYNAMDIYSLRNHVFVKIYSWTTPLPAYLGNPFTTTGHSVNGIRMFPITIGDYNGDGKSDIFFPALGKVLMATGGMQFIEELLPSYDGSESYKEQFLALDFNNDGKDDIVKLSPILVKEPGSTSYTIWTDNQGAHQCCPVQNYYKFHGLKIEHYFRMGATSVSLPWGHQSFQRMMYVRGIPYAEMNRFDKKLVVLFTRKSKTDGSKTEIALLGGDLSNKISFFTNKSFLDDEYLLQNIHVNGTNQTITYANLKPGNGVYFAGNDIEIFPNYTINIAEKFKVVSKIQKSGPAYYKSQDFRYQGAVAHAEGLGFFGFQSTLKTNWYDDPSKIISHVTKFDMNKRGAVIQDFSVLGLVSPTLTLAATDSFISKSNTLYNNEDRYDEEPVLPNKVYKLRKTRVLNCNGLTGVNSETTMVYNARGNPTTITTTVKNGTTLERTTEENYTYAPLITTPYMIDRPRSKSTTVTLAGNDVERSQEVYLYEKNLLKQLRLRPRGHNTRYLTENNKYDRYGNLIQKTLSATGMAPRVSKWEYDTPTHRFVSKKTDILGNQTTYTYDASSGLMLTETIHNSTNPMTTTYAYDKWGKTIKKTDYLGNNEKYTYAKTRGYGVLKTTIGDDGSSSSTQIDAYGREVRRGTKNSNGKWSYVDLRYDIEDRLISETLPYFNDSSATVWNEMQYDLYGRLIQAVSLKTTGSQGKVINYTYSGLTTIEDDGIQSKQSVYNALDQIVSLTETPGGTITYSYYANGKLKESVYEGGKIKLEYDGWGNKTKLEDPSAGMYTYQYNAFGELTKETTPKGTVKNFIDDFGRLTQTEEESQNEKSYYTRYFYNTDHILQGAIREEYLTGKVTNEEYYEYDDYKRPKKITLATPHATFIKELTYDTFGRIAKEKQTATVNISGKNSSKTFRYSYRFGSRYQIFDDSNGQVLWTGNEVNSKDQLTRGTFGNELLLEQYYDEYGYIRQADIYNPRTQTPISRPDFTLTYQFDSQTGNLDARQNYAFNHFETFQYDTLDRLVQWDNETVMLHHDTFDQAIGEFEPKTCATLTNENGSLKVAITPNCTGIKKVLLTKAKVGDQLKIRFDFNKGTTHITRISIWEYNPDNGQYFKSPKDYTSNGTQSFEHTVTQYPVIELHFDTLPLAETYPMLFFLDNLLVTMDRPETQRYDNRGRITENKLGQYNYTDTDKAYRNTSIDLNAEDASYYQNREGIFNDGMEAQKGWSDLGIGWSIFGKPIYDDSKSKTGKYSLKIHNPTDKSHTLHADRWIPIDNPHGASYTFSGWVYSDRPSSRILLFMNSETETGYYTIVADTYTETTNQWVYMERTVYVPSHIKKLNIRVDNQGGGNVWFDDIRIRKTSNPKTDLRQLNVTYDLFKKPITITETGVEKVAFSYTADHFRNTMYYGGLEDPEQQPLRKDYAADGSMEITTNQQTGVSTFVFFVGGDAYTAPVVFKDNGTTGEYLYLHRDYQGTIVAISNQNGNFVEKRLFDPWGKLLKVQDGQGHNLVGLTLLDRGYTGHEHLQSVGLINMNGRLYDPKLHRFLSPDTYIQDPYNTQNYNRYGYCLNNPTKYTDPTGEFWWQAIGYLFSAYIHGAQATGEVNPYKWGDTGVYNAILGPTSSAVSYTTTEYANSYIDNYNNHPKINYYGAVINQNDHPYVPVAVIQMPTQHHFLGVNMTALSDGNFFDRFVYGTFNIPVQYLMGRSVQDGSMRNLNGTPTATEEGTLAFGSLPLWFIGGNAGATQAEASTKLLEQTGQVARTGTKLGTYELEITHGLTKSKNAFSKLKANIKLNGIQEPIKFVEHNGKRFVVDGHHRLRAAKELGIQNVPVQQVKLPYAGYKSVDDLIYSRY
ncbi:RHS repeat-associated core domain-containing protein [Flavobacterium sp. WV_118_3]|uniref:RHS repeat-associated core domain-containing protein n=1 Tax=Flavobacterium sp. WV_118_3 TaxID=3151764 RepID=UPI00321A7248